jgi:hypothetical protein
VRSGRAGEGVIGSGKWKRIKRVYGRRTCMGRRDAASACPMPATVLLTRGVCSTSGRAVQRPGAAFCLPGGTQANAPSRYRAWTTTGNHGTDPRLLCMLIDLISAPPCTAPAPMHAHTLGRFIINKGNDLKFGCLKCRVDQSHKQHGRPFSTAFFLWGGGGGGK